MPEDVEKKRARWRAWYVRNRKKYNSYSVHKKRVQRALISQWMQEFKATKHCALCFENDSRCLEFHHTDPSNKSYAVARMMRGYSKKTILKEISKCIILCANCHRKLHKKTNYI